MYKTQVTCLCKYIQAELRLRSVEFHQSQVDVRNKKQKVSMLRPIVHPILNIYFPSHHNLEKNPNSFKNENMSIDSSSQCVRFGL